jgi:hypothetical protein
MRIDQNTIIRYEKQAEELTADSSALFTSMTKAAIRTSPDAYWIAKEQNQRVHTEEVSENRTWGMR